MDIQRMMKGQQANMDGYLFSDYYVEEIIRMKIEGMNWKELRIKTPDPLLRIRDPELQDWIDYTNLVINSGKYEFPITTSVPTQQANSGEQFVYTASDGTSDRRFYVYIAGQWCRIDFNTDGSVNAGGFGDRILDDDANTGIFTQFVANEERLRHYSNGVYVVAIDTYGLQMANEYKLVFDGLGGDTYWTYSTASTYLQAYVNGTLRMEI
jgi:hypothetical protein